MGKEFNIEQRQRPRRGNQVRRIVTPLPHPDSLPTLDKLRQFEPQSMRGQPPLVWGAPKTFC
jgi:4-aminobutyrate aminotransferase/diaminobutyrate-pyruvate transaminase/4-aminobutyrate aminotransferase/(S)-3-amino-2-methylpropionate transaminase